MRSASITSSIRARGKSWANDHEGNYPWKVDPNDGGSMNATVWADHLRVMEKDLDNLNILICPFDKERKPAPDWASLAGFDNASYFLGLTAVQARLTMLLADDSVSRGRRRSGPFLELTLPAVPSMPRGTIRKEVCMERGRGNVVLSDGSVHTWTSRQFKEQIAVELATGSTNVVLSKPQGTL